jgi:hypothetical protein
MAVDELQALRELYSSPEPPLESVVREQRETLMTIIETTTTADQPRPRRSRRRRVVALIGVPIAATVVIAAGWAALREDARESVSFACVADGVTAILPNDGSSPLEACRSLWETGGMVIGSTSAPPLVACVDNRSAVLVIEGASPDACQAKGMAAWTAQAEYEAMGAAVRAARVSFHDRFEQTGNGCATEQDWRSELADQSGAQGWNIEVDQSVPQRRCYDIGSIDPTTRSVTLVAVPGDYSIGCDPRTGC